MIFKLFRNVMFDHIDDMNILRQIGRTRRPIKIAIFRYYRLLKNSFNKSIVLCAIWHVLSNLYGYIPK